MQQHGPNGRLPPYEWAIEHLLRTTQETQAAVNQLIGEFRGFRDETVWRQNRAEVREWERVNTPKASRPLVSSVLKEISIRDVIWVVCLVVLALAGHGLELAQKISGLAP